MHTQKLGRAQSKTACYPVYLFPFLQQLRCTIFLRIRTVYDYQPLACEKEYNSLSFTAGVIQVCTHEPACSKLAHINKKSVSAQEYLHRQILTQHILVFLWITDMWKMQYSKICRNVQYSQSARPYVSIFSYICRWQTDKESK